MYNHIEYVLDGTRYESCGWFGCQLESYEWIRKPAGYERIIDLNDGEPVIKLKVFSTVREGFKIRTTWTIPLSGDIDNQNNQIRTLKARLKRLG